MTLPASLSHAVQLTQQWLKELRDNGDLDDEAAALSALRAVLHQLRDRLTPEEAVDLAAQLPLIVRGIYFEAWRPARSSKVPLCGSRCCRPAAAPVGSTPRAAPGS